MELHCSPLSTKAARRRYSGWLWSTRLEADELIKPCLDPRQSLRTDFYFQHQTRALVANLLPKSCGCRGVPLEDSLSEPWSCQTRWCSWVTRLFEILPGDLQLGGARSLNQQRSFLQARCLTPRYPRWGKSSRGESKDHPRGLQQTWGHGPPCKWSCSGEGLCSSEPVMHQQKLPLAQEDLKLAPEEHMLAVSYAQTHGGLGGKAQPSKSTYFPREDSFYLGAATNIQAGELLDLQGWKVSKPPHPQPPAPCPKASHMIRGKENVTPLIYVQFYVIGWKEHMLYQ